MGAAGSVCWEDGEMAQDVHKRSFLPCLGKIVANVVTKSQCEGLVGAVIIVIEWKPGIRLLAISKRVEHVT